MAGILDGLVNVSVSTVGATPQLANSNTPAFLAYHTLYGDFIRTYTSPAGWTSDGGSILDPAYDFLVTTFAQNPAPASAKIIRGSTAVTQTVTFLVTDITKRAGLNGRFERQGDRVVVS